MGTQQAFSCSSGTAGQATQSLNVAEGRWESHCLCVCLELDSEGSNSRTGLVFQGRLCLLVTHCKQERPQTLLSLSRIPSLVKTAILAKHRCVNSIAYSTKSLWLLCAFPVVFRGREVAHI